MEDLDSILDRGVQVDFTLQALEHLINAWRPYRGCEAAAYRSVMGKLERAQARAARRLHQAEQAHEAMRKVEIDRGWRMEDDKGFMPEQP